MPLPDFWRNSGFHLLERDPAGRLRVTDDFLRAYYLRPEVHPVEESDQAERELHASLMAEPRRRVTQSELNAMQDADARDNYRLVLKFRDRLLEAGTVESCYMGLFKGAIHTLFDLNNDRTTFNLIHEATHKFSDTVDAPGGYISANYPAWIATRGLTP